MTTVNAIVTALFDALLRPFAGASPWYGMTAVSLATGVMMLLVFRAASNQRALRRTKDRIRAHLLVVRLYRDDMRVLLRAQQQILRNNLIYLAHSLVPLAVMILPVVLILVQVNARWGYRPLRPGESAILSVRLAPDASLSKQPRLVAPPGLRVETPALSIPALRQFDWRIGAVRPGRHQVRIEMAGRVVEKEVVVAQGWARLTRQRVGSGLLAVLAHPGEKPLPGDVGLRSLSVDYPPSPLRFFRWDLHWLVAFFGLSLAFGFALKGLLRVEV